MFKHSLMRLWLATLTSPQSSHMKKLAFLLFSIWPLSPLLAQTEELKLVTADLPPFCIQNGEQPGMVVEIFLEACKRGGLKGSVSFEPWPRAQESVQAGNNLAIAPFVRIPEREKFYIWVKEAILYDTVFFSINGKHYDLTTAKHLNGVLVQTGTNFETFLINEGFKNIQSIPQGNMNGPKLSGGRAGAWFVPTPQARWVWKTMNLPGTLSAGPPIIENHGWLAMSPSSDPKIINAISKGIDSVVADGTREKIMAKYVKK